MSTSHLVAGVSTVGLFQIDYETQIRKRYDPSNGKPYDMEVRQLVIEFMSFPIRNLFSELSI